MEKENTDKRIMQGVLEKINTGQVKMRPRFYFTVKVGLVIGVSILALIASSLLISFIIFSLKMTGHLLLLGFGAQGILLFFKFFPWLLLALVCILFIALESLLKRFRFGYRQSFAKLMGLIVLISLVFGIIISSTDFHQILLRRARQKKLPVVGDMYEGSRHPAPEEGLYRGQVTAIKGNIFIIHEEEEPQEEGHIIFAPPGVELVPFLQIGDIVFVATVKVREELHAIGIKKLEIIK